MVLSAAVHLVVLLAPAVLLLAACVDLLVFFHLSHQDASDPLYLERGDGGNAGSGAS